MASYIWGTVEAAVSDAANAAMTALLLNAPTTPAKKPIANGGSKNPFRYLAIKLYEQEKKRQPVGRLKDEAWVRICSGLDKGKADRVYAEDLDTYLEPKWKKKLDAYNRRPDGDYISTWSQLWQKFPKAVKRPVYPNR
jgi:hypothetical protein